MGDEKNHGMMKIVLISIGLGALSFLACLFPKIFKNNRFVKKVFPALAVIAAGIQLATVIVDLVPEIHGCHHHDGHSHDAHHHSHDHHDDHSHDQHSHNSHFSEFAPFILGGGLFITLLSIDKIFLHGTGDGKHKHSHSDHHHHHHHGEDHGSDACSHSHGNIGSCNINAIKSAGGKIQAIIILFAISAHSFFEGLALNLSKVKVALCIGLFFHKALESFSLGVAIFKSSFSTLTGVLLTLFYSTLTPIGIILANLLSQKLGQGMNLDVWFNNLSLGSLLFVVFVETIGHYFNNNKNVVRNSFYLSTGYVLGCAAIVLSH